MGHLLLRVRLERCAIRLPNGMAGHSLTKTVWLFSYTFLTATKFQTDIISGEFLHKGTIPFEAPEALKSAKLG
ncbi:hypothetical protein MGYG_07538 [Nannizzia gypsea CBS 118893]|uniref:Uncharacterized protein n=1 Tax=Arthroderma gypseum (strain ATCC MYA-4604 / CBS 118893) TaxID=535722 RepID=E4V3F9_ARTGP|nr:hypothetical protein MGYG_07538 [Nannizzia gypsea CBS 118893]EFR04533.1 hypothetical protein MGYG_07538 [Nannizzia gypsea CBS 118893]